MRSKRGFLSGLLVFSMVVLAACGTAPSGSTDQGGTSGTGTPSQPSQPARDTRPAIDELVVAFRGDAATLDPHMRNENTTTNWQQHVFDYLMMSDPDGKIVPKLAESWTMVDPSTWEFKLRKGVKFHNGEPFNAEAAAYSILRARDHAKSQMKHHIINVAEAKAKDENTLVLTTKGPTPMLLLGLKEIGMVPREYIAKAGDEKFALEPIGTGPYKAVKWVKSDYFAMEANPDYWGPKPEFKKVKFRPIPDNATRVAALLSGEIHVAETINAEDVPRVKQDKNLYVTTTPSQRFIYLTFDQFRDKGSHGSFLPEQKNPFMNVKVRKAIAYGINVPEIIEHIHGGNGEPASQPHHNKAFGYNPNIPLKKYDPEMAKKLLAEAGYPSGFKVRLDATNDRYINDKQVAEAIGGQLKKIGLDVVVNAYSKSNFFSNMDKGQFTMFMGGWGTTNVASSLTALFHTKGGGYGGTNRAGYSNKKVDQLIQQGSTTMDDKEREKIFQEALRIIVEEDQAWVPLYYEALIHGVDSRIEYQARFDETIYTFEMKSRK